MTAKNYPQIPPQENSLGLHYTALRNPGSGQSTTCRPKISKPGSNRRSSASRLLKKSLRFRKKGGGREIFRLGWVHPEEWALALGHFRFLFTPLDTLRPSEPGAWAGEQGCRRQRRRRTRRGPCRGRAPSAVRARPLFCPSRSIPRCVCAAAG